MADIAGVRGVCLVGDIFYALRQIQNAVGLLVQSCLGNPDHDWICSPDSVGCDQFFDTKELDLFTLVLVLLVVYGGTVGKKHVQKLDDWARAKFSNREMED